MRARWVRVGGMTRVYQLIENLVFSFLSPRLGTIAKRELTTGLVLIGLSQLIELNLCILAGDDEWKSIYWKTIARCLNNKISIFHFVAERPDSKWNWNFWLFHQHVLDFLLIDRQSFLECGCLHDDHSMRYEEFHGFEIVSSDGKLSEVDVNTNIMKSQNKSSSIGPDLTII